VTLFQTDHNGVLCEDCLEAAARLSADLYREWAGARQLRHDEAKQCSRFDECGNDHNPD
jgi:hypothetical protein